MVSHSDNYRASSLTLRGNNASTAGIVPVGSSSVVSASAAHHSSSSSSASRARRYNRSHAGGTSFVPCNEFPVFSQTGDVDILVRVRSGHENRYLLHRDTLARCSGFFEVSTSKEWSRGPSQTRGVNQIQGQSLDNEALTHGDEVARVEGKESRQRWRYELDLGEDDNDMPILVQKDEETIPPVPPVPPLPSSQAQTQAQTQSIFGGPVMSNSRTNNTTMTFHDRDRDHDYSSGKSRHSKHSSEQNRQSKPPFSNPGFFRSMANLAMPHSSSSRPRRGSHSHGSHGSYGTNSNSNSNNHAVPHETLLPPPTPEEIDLLRDYDNLFRIMYNYPPRLDAVNIADAYVQCKSLLALADEYDALAVVGPRVDHHLLQFQSRLWRQIAKYPISYLRLGYLARSRVIFQEALVHVVGQWPAGERSLRAVLPQHVLDLIEDKVDALAEAVARVEARLFRLHLMTRSGERVSPSTAYLDWLAVSLFRQWLAENTTPPEMVPVVPTAVQQAQPARIGGSDGRRRNHGGSSSHNNSNSNNNNNNNNQHHRSRGRRHGNSYDHRAAGRAGSSDSSSSSGSGNRGGGGGGGGGGGQSDPSTALTLHVRTTEAPPMGPPLAALGRTYRTLGMASGAVFLGHDECKRFLKMTPDLYNRDNLRRFEKRIDELKAMAREVVRPLMSTGLELEMAAATSSSSSSSSARYGLPGGITYFTCTYVGERDLPWLEEDY